MSNNVSYMLHVEVGTACNASSCDCGAHDLNEAFSTKSGDLFVVSSGSVKFSFDEQSSTTTTTTTTTSTDNTMETAVAIFVPPSFIDQYFPASRHKGSCKSVAWLGDQKIDLEINRI